jgi:predicted nucleotidyltransferase
MPSKKDFSIYMEAIGALKNAGIPCVVGGGIAVAAYGRKRATKDIDLYVMPQDAGPSLDALERVGFEVNPMPDVKWLSKAYKGGVPVDFILENIGSIVSDEETMRRCQHRPIDGYVMPIMSPEDLVFRKVLAMRSMRDDWYDCIAVLSNTYHTFDWDYFLKLSRSFSERALSFVLFVKTDWDHAIPVPQYVISALAGRIPEMSQYHTPHSGAHGPGGRRSSRVSP